MNQPVVLPRGRPDNNRLMRAIQALPLDKPFEVIVRPYKAKRSDSQNAALWGHAYKVLGEFMGLQGDEEMQLLHRQLCSLYFGTAERLVMGERVTVPKRTTTRNEFGQRDVLNKVQFADFFAFVQRKAAEAGCIIADPSLDHYLDEPKEAAA